MKIRILIFFAAAVALGVTGWITQRQSEPDPVDLKASSSSAPLPAREKTGALNSKPDPGSSQEETTSSILVNYASEEATPFEDLGSLNEVLKLFQFEMNDARSLPTSGNKAITKALLGNNAKKIRFLNTSFAHINENGELIDRWKTPIYFHFITVEDPEILSAGPDKILWNEDDVSWNPHKNS